MASDILAPAVSRPLVDYLDGLYQNRCPLLGMSDQDIWYAAGRASVVTKLRSIHETQTLRSLEGNS